MNSTTRTHGLGEAARVATAGAGLLFLICALWAPSDADAAFPGDNGRIAYSAETPVGPAVLWTVNSDGSQPLQLTQGPWDSAPAYSPDGTRIAFTREDDLMVANSDGSGVSRLFDGIEEDDSDTTWVEDYEDPETEVVFDIVKVDSRERSWEEVEDPAFSADGARLVTAYYIGSFLEQDICAVAGVGDETCLPPADPGYFEDSTFECDCNGELILLDSTTGAVLGDPVGSSALLEAWAPAYSSDGKLAFMGWDGDQNGVYVIPTPGAAPQLVVPDVDGPVDFSPDGSKLVTVSPDEEELLIADATSGAILSTIPAPPRAGAEDVELEDPEFSPDGTRIAFAYEAELETGPDVERLHTIGLDGSGLTTFFDEDPDFAWRPIPRPAPPAPLAAPVRPPVVAAQVIAKKRVKLDRKGRATIGWIVCGSSPCKPKVLSARLKVGKRKLSVKARAPKRLAPGKRAKIRVKVKGKALAALKRKGKGRLTTRVRAGKGLKPKKLRSTVVAKRHRKKPKRVGK